MLLLDTSFLIELEAEVSRRHLGSARRFLQARAIAYRMATLQAALAQRFGENDTWIAAPALAYHALLIGREKAFARVPRLKYIGI